MFACCATNSSQANCVEQIKADELSPDHPQLDDSEGQAHTHGIRTQADDPVTVSRALEKLQQGNARYVVGTPLRRTFDATARNALAQHGQLPFAAVIGCADSRCPVEVLFDVQPGDVFVLRNAGNTCTHAEGSMVGSIEYCVSALRTQLVLVLGHTMCGAIMGATKAALQPKSHAGAPPSMKRRSSLEGLLDGLGPVALQASGELGQDASIDDVAAQAVRVNVFHTIHKLMTYSQILREKISKGEVEVQGAIYDIVSGKVEFLGLHPQQQLFLDLDASFDDFEAKTTCPEEDASSLSQSDGEGTRAKQTMKR